MPLSAVMVVLRKHNKTKGKTKVLKEELIELEYTPTGSTEKQKEIFRRICYQNEQNRQYVFLTNTVGIEVEEVVLLYKKR